MLPAVHSDVVQEEVSTRQASSPNVLVLARNYPNNVMPQLGLWTQRLVESGTWTATMKVVAPVPFAPPLPHVGRLAYYRRYRDVHRHHWDGVAEIFHPRLLLGPGYTLHNQEALVYALAVAGTVHRLRRSFSFDLIHAHFTYADGVAACLLGRRYGVPVVITEHASWLPWMERYPLVRRQATWAARACDAHIAVSESVRQGIGEITGDSEKIRVIPNVVDGRIFRPRPAEQRKPGQMLFVGAVRYSKGVDLLLEALREVRGQYRAARLILAGEPLFLSYQREAERLRQLAHELGVADSVAIVGGKTPAEVATLMAESSVVVLPSRNETFGTVLIEAMACGTPVVATRCGGPEEIVAPDVGMLVPPEDPPALAAALVEVLKHPSRFASAPLRDYALSRYGMPRVARQLADTYAAVLRQELDVGNALLHRSAAAGVKDP